MSSGLTEEVRAIGAKYGATAVGVTGVEAFDRELTTLHSHKRNGMAGPLHFTYSDPALAANVRKTFPWAQSIVVIGYNYLPSASTPASTGAIVGRFATSDQYDRVRSATDAILAHLRSQGAKAKTLIDDNRLLDRAVAVRSGVGWTGKSTMVLAPGSGPWMLLGSVITDADLQTATPMHRTCGTCVACIPACPTGAIGEHGLDARRCLSTWLQNPGSIPRWIRPLLGRRIYGCDDCLTSCPPGGKALEMAGNKPLDLPFVELLEMEDEQLLDRFSWWYVPRRDGRFIRRNLLVAAGNSREGSIAETLERHLSHRSSMIRSHAAWALARAVGKTSRRRLIEALDQERAPETRMEIALALVMIDHPENYEALLALDELVTTTIVL